MKRSLTRRRLLGASAGALGWAALAASGTAQQGGSGGGGDSPPPDFGGYLDATDNYDGTVVDRRGQAAVTVRVGVEANGGDFGFGPPAVHVDAGATVRWEWVGESPHSVVSEGDGPLSSGGVTSERGVNYEYTFEEDGIYLYHCAPHEALGMRGAVVVGTDYPRRTPASTPTERPTPTPQGEPLPSAPAADWPARGFGPANQSVTPGTAGPQTGVREAWHVRFDEAVLDPVLVDGVVYASLFDGTGALALDAATGERLWAREVPGRVWAADGERVYVASDGGVASEGEYGGFVFALDAATGETVWTRQDAEDDVNDLQVADGRVYAAVGEAVETLDAERGDRRRLATVDGRVVGLAVADGTVYAASQRNFGTNPRDPLLVVSAFDAASGDRRWRFERESFPPTRPTVAGDTVYVGSESHAIHAVDAGDGTERWRAELGSSVTGLAVVPDADEYAQAVRGTVYAGCADYRLYALDAASGDRRWRERTRGVVTPPSVADGVVYATNRGYVHAELTEDQVVREDGAVDRDMAVHAFDGATGERRWTVELAELARTGQTPAYVGDEPVAADGTLYLGLNNTDGTFELHALAGDAARTAGAAETASGTEAQSGATGTPTEGQSATGTNPPTAGEGTSAAEAGTTAESGAGFTALTAALGLLGAAGLGRLPRIGN